MVGHPGIALRIFHQQSRRGVRHHAHQAFALGNTARAHQIFHVPRLAQAGVGTPVHRLRQGREYA